MGKALFLLAFTRFFTETRISLWLGRVGCVFGIITEVSFVGVVATPWNLYVELTDTLVTLL
jgi:hypothetical protein